MKKIIKVLSLFTLVFGALAPAVYAESQPSSDRVDNQIISLANAARTVKGCIGVEKIKEFLTLNSPNPSDGPIYQLFFGGIILPIATLGQVASNRTLLVKPLIERQVNHWFDQ